MRSDCVLTAYLFLSCCNCCDVGESAAKPCALCGVGWSHLYLPVFSFSFTPVVFEAVFVFIATQFWKSINPLNAELNPICHLLALLGGATIVVVRRFRVKISSYWNRSDTSLICTKCRSTYMMWKWAQVKVLCDLIYVKVDMNLANDVSYAIIQRNELNRMLEKRLRLYQSRVVYITSNENYQRTVSANLKYKYQKIPSAKTKFKPKI